MFGISHANLIAITDSECKKTAPLKSIYENEEHEAKIHFHNAYSSPLLVYNQLRQRSNLHEPFEICARHSNIYAPTFRLSVCVRVRLGPAKGLSNQNAILPRSRRNFAHRQKKQRPGAPRGHCVDSIIWRGASGFGRNVRYF